MTFFAYGVKLCDNVTICHICDTLPTILYTIHYTLYTIHYTLYTIHYTLYTIHYTTHYTTHYHQKKGKKNNTIQKKKGDDTYDKQKL